MTWRYQVKKRCMWLTTVAALVYMRAWGALGSGRDWWVGLGVALAIAAEGAVVAPVVGAAADGAVNLIQSAPLLGVTPGPAPLTHRNTLPLRGGAESTAASLKHEELALESLSIDPRLGIQNVEIGRSRVRLGGVPYDAHGLQ